MKTLKITQTMRTIGFFIAFMVVAAVANTAQAQTGLTVKGIISTQEGPLEGASVMLKGTGTGTVTDAKGEFTFPKTLKAGDILAITYLGFQPVDYKITNDTTFIRVMLVDDAIEFVGAPNSDKPYKSKRSKE